MTPLAKHTAVPFTVSVLNAPVRASKVVPEAVENPNHCVDVPSVNVKFVPEAVANPNQDVEVPFVIERLVNDDGEVPVVTRFVMLAVEAKKFVDVPFVAEKFVVKRFVVVAFVVVVFPKTPSQRNAAEPSENMTSCDGNTSVSTFPLTPRFDVVTFVVTILLILVKISPPK